MNELETTFKSAQRGCIEAYGTLVERYQDMAVGYAYSILRDFHLAQDAAQEAFIEAFPTLERVHSLAAFPSWMRRIVFKHCDRLTRKDRRFTFLSAEEALALPAREPLPDRVLEDREMHSLLNDAVSDLPEGEREVVTMYYISDQSQNDIATFLDVPVSTVKNRLRSARTRMRERLLDMVEDNLKANRPSKDAEFVNGVLKIVAPVKEKDSDAIYRRLEEKGRADMARQARNGRIAESHFDWKTSRVGMVDGKIATHVGVYELNFQIGDAVVRAAGINWLDVNKETADEGKLQETIGAAVEAMEANGYDIAVTRSERPEWLAPHGFVYGMPVQQCYYVNVEDLPTEPPDVILERVHANEIASRKDLAEIYNHDHKGLTGCSIRPTYHRGKCPPPDDKDFPAYIFKDDRGKVVGYLYDGPFRDKEMFTFSDAAGDPEQILRVLAQKVREFEIDRVRFIKMPYRSPLAKRIRQGDYILEVKKVDNDGRSASQIRLINLRSTLEKIAPVLGGRLAASTLSGWEGTVSIEADGQAASLAIGGAKVDVSDAVDSDHSVRGGQEVAQLLISTEVPDEVCEAGGITLAGDAGKLIEVLFPEQRGQMPNEDL